MENLTDAIDIDRTSAAMQAFSKAFTTVQGDDPVIRARAALRLLPDEVVTVLRDSAQIFTDLAQARLGERRD